MKSKIERDDFLRNHILTNLKINGMQSLAAFFLNVADLENNNYDKNLWLYDLAEKRSDRLEIDGDIKDFVWKENEVIILMEKGNNTVFFRYDFEQKDKELLYSVPMSVSEFIITKKNLFFTCKSSNIERTDNVSEGTEIPFFVEGMGLFSNNRKALFAYNLSSGEIEKVTDTDIHLDCFVINGTESKIAFISYDINPYIKNESNIYLVDVETKAVEIITGKDVLSVSNLAFIDDETIVFAGADLKTYGRNENHGFFAVNIYTKKQIKITEDFDKNCFGKEIATDARFSATKDFYEYKDWIYYLTLEGSNTYLNRISKDGKNERLSSGTGTIDSFAVTEEGILFIGLREQSLHEIYLLKDSAEKRLTAFNEWLAEERTLIKPEPVNAVNKSGMKIEGWVMKPVDFREGEIYPGVLCIHGGPKMAYGDVYFHLFQLLASHGYFVFFCNPRGSDGRGNEFADNRGHFATYAFEDIMCFTDEILNKYESLDKERLGVMGGSYGGYMTNYIIGQSDRFKAAVSERGISNLISNFNTSDIGYLYVSNYMGGSNPWNVREAYIRDSPLTFADKVATSTLFIHGKNDNRCNYTESLQMYSAVRYFGTEAKFCLFEGESHSLEVKGKPLNKIKRFDEIIKWFDTHIGRGE